MKKACFLSFPLSAQRRLRSAWASSEVWSDRADAQADLSLRWAHSHLSNGFVMRRFMLYLCFCPVWYHGPRDVDCDWTGSWPLSFHIFLISLTFEGLCYSFSIILILVKMHIVLWLQYLSSSPCLGRYFRLLIRIVSFPRLLNIGTSHNLITPNIIPSKESKHS